MIRRFALKIEGNQIFYIEDHTHIFSHPTWILFCQNHGLGFAPQSFIVGLVSGTIDNARARLSRFESGEGAIGVAEIKSVNQFIGNHVMLSEDGKVPDGTSTGMVVGILQFS